MAVATSVAIGMAIAAGASTAGQIYVAKKSADTAKSVAHEQATAETAAGDRQTAAMNQQLALTRQAMMQTQQSYAPTIQMGNNALSMLGKGMGMPSLGSSMSGGQMGQGGNSGMPPMKSSGSYNFLGNGNGGPSIGYANPPSVRQGLDAATSGQQPTMVNGAPNAAPGSRQVGEIKQFPNGKRGRWDGQGWEEV